MSDDVQPEPRRGREGNRWVNERPSPEEVAEWFKDTVKLHDGMEHADFVSGITLIQETARTTEVTGLDSNGRPVIEEDVLNVFFTPYPKVETRVDYFLRWLEANKDEFVGTVEPVATKETGGLAVGFAPVRVALPDGKVASLITCSRRVKVVTKDSAEWVDQTDADGVTRSYLRGDIVLLGAPGTKSVPMLDRYGKVSDNAVERAETGAMGRALGFGGFLVIPGTGVATAEDMREAQQQGQIPGAPAETAAQPEPGADERASDDPDTLMRAQALQMIERLKNDYPDDLRQFQAWARERNFRGLNEITGAALKSVVKKLEKTLSNAERKAPAPEIDLAGDGEKEKESTL